MRSGGVKCGSTRRSRLTTSVSFAAVAGDEQALKSQAGPFRTAEKVLDILRSIGLPTFLLSSVCPRRAANQDEWVRQLIARELREIYAPRLWSDF